MIFKLSDLDGYAIISEPSTLIVQCNSTSPVFINDENPRWLINLKAVSKKNLDLISRGLGEVEYEYSDVGSLLMSGAIWENQIINSSDLPVKGERVIAVFGYVGKVLMCTGITLIPRKEPDLFIAGADALRIYEEFKNILYGEK